MALYRPESDFETELSTSISSSDVILTLNDVPNETTGYLVIEPGTSNMEIIKYTGVSDSTITGVVRGLAKDDTDDSTSVSANQKSHSAGSLVVMANVHYYLAKTIDVWNGNAYSQGTDFYLGNSADVDMRFYAGNGDTNLPFWGYDATANAWIVADDGVTSHKISDGGSGVTAGDGIDITAGAVAVDLGVSGGLQMSAIGGDQQVIMDTGASDYVATTAVGSADASKLAVLSAMGNSGVVPDGFMPYVTPKSEIDQLAGIGATVTDTNLDTVTDGSEASDIHYHTALDNAEEVTNVRAELLGQKGDGCTETTVGTAVLTRYMVNTALITLANGDDAILTSGNDLIAGETDPTDPGIEWADNPHLSTLATFKLNALTNQDIFFGFYQGALAAIPADAIDTNNHAGFFIADGTLYASTADGGTQDKTDITGALTLTNYNIFKIDLTTGTDAKFYVNDSLLATLNTNLPAGNGAPAFNIGITNVDGADADKMILLKHPYVISLID